MAHKIAVFNHKGGVSKTTTVFHLGWMLTNLGKRVLLVDADSQYNLTKIIVGDYEDFYGCISNCRYVSTVHLIGSMRSRTSRQRPLMEHTRRLSTC